MKAEYLYNLGEYCWIMHNNTPIRKQVKSVNIIIYDKKLKPAITYGFDLTNPVSAAVIENKVFRTKEELIRSL